jgi:hypothetical protein
MLIKYYILILAKQITDTQIITQTQPTVRKAGQMEAVLSKEEEDMVVHKEEVKTAPEDRRYDCLSRRLITLLTRLIRHTAKIHCDQ